MELHKRRHLTAAQPSVLPGPDSPGISSHAGLLCCSETSSIFRFFIPLQREGIGTSTAPRFLIAILCAFRMINTLLVQTYFNPDEYWQGPEVAHRMVFGYGHLTWEWSENAQLRSCIHPLIFAALYKVLQLLGLDTRWAVAFGPRLLQAVFAGIGDYCVYKLTAKIFGEQAGRWALFSSVTSWFNFYCITRTFSNSLEAVLTVAALCLWPIDYGPDNDVVSKSRETVLTSKMINLANALALAAAAVLVRPTSVLVWIPLGLFTITSAYSWKEAALVACMAISIGVCAIAIGIWVDSAFYSSKTEWTFVLGNFVSFNLINGLDKLYGAHPWHWYFSQGLPAVLGSLLPTTLMGGYLVCWKQSKGAIVFVSIIGFVSFALSLTSHKEFRFVLPLLPIGCVLSGHALNVIDEKTLGKFTGQTNRSQSQQWRGWRSMFVNAVFISMFLNFSVAAFLSLVHQRGAIDVMNFLSEEGRSTNARRLRAVHFLTSCHATPYYSMLHLPGRFDETDENSLRFDPIGMRFLDCSPEMMVDDFCGGRPCTIKEIASLPIYGGDKGSMHEYQREGETRLSQSAAFESDPEIVLKYLYKTRVTSEVDDNMVNGWGQESGAEGKVVAEWHWGKLPSHIVIFSSEETISVRAFLQGHGCYRIQDFFHEMVQGDIHSNSFRGRIAVWYCEDY